MATRLNIPMTEAQQQLKQLVNGGAEIEQRSLDNELLHVGPLARGVANIEQEDDSDIVTTWFIPIEDPVGTDPQGRAVFDEQAPQPRPLPIVQFDLFDNGNVGMRHEQSGTYSVVRPATEQHLARIDQFDVASEHDLFA